MTPWKIPKMWEGGECWIIGGGLSFPRQFGVSEDIIERVISKQDSIDVYSDYFKPLHNRHVIGVNIAFMLGDWISVFYFCDASFLRVHHERIFKFRNLKATCVNHLDRDLLPQAINIKRMKRDMRYGLSNKADTICWNFNSGAAAIDFAAHTGVKRILLLGFDMKLDDVSKQAHWHKGMKGYKPSSSAVYRRFLRTFPAIAADAKQRKIEILNVNTDSAIEQFPKVKLEEVL